ncbi:MAG: PhoX family protein, partial [Bacteroidia bacterium]|nr:PhoX family protein [Bacteroidia bacterium]
MKFCFSFFCLILALFSTNYSQTIGTFQSVQPVTQGPTLIIPPTHQFQVLIQSGTPLGSGGTMPVSSDYCGYVSSTNSSREGVLCVNSEFVPGAVTILDIRYDSTTGYWQRIAANSVNFGSAATSTNCGGAITPWKTMVTCEEIDFNFDLNGDGYRDYGWVIELDPFTRQVRDYDNNGTKDKIWAMGRFKHENCAFANDSLTVYEGEDNSSNGFLFKFVADQKMNLSSGKLYALVVNGTTGSWVQIPNTTKSERNSTISLAVAAGATEFERVEDVEIGPDGKIYFTSTSTGKIFRFRDLGTTISDFEIFVDNVTFPIQHANGITNVTFSAPDNLAFDAQGNLWVCQDGGGNFLWMVRPGHTTANPQIQIFGVMPAGSEPTGISFTPDGEFMFLDIQHPSANNTTLQPDVTGATYKMNADLTLVIARNERWGSPSVQNQPAIHQP